MACVGGLFTPRPFMCTCTFGWVGGGVACGDFLAGVLCCGVVLVTSWCMVRVGQRGSSNSKSEDEYCVKITKKHL